MLDAVIALCALLLVASKVVNGYGISYCYDIIGAGYHPTPITSQSRDALRYHRP